MKISYISRLQRKYTDAKNRQSEKGIPAVGQAVLLIGSFLLCGLCTRVTVYHHALKHHFVMGQR